MKKTPDPSRKHLLRPKLTLAAALSLLLLGWLSWDAYNDYRYAEAQLPALGRIEIVRAKIIHLDEVLTMSARMAAASGNLDWETRYRRFEPQLDQSIKEALQLDQSIKEALQLDPNASHGAAAAQIDAANVALVAMENRAFELVRQGKNAEAQRLLSSGEYEDRKKTYAAGMTEFDDHLLEAGSSMRAELRADMLRSVIATIGSTVLLILGSLFVFRATRRWQAVIVESNQQLNQKTAELGELNNQLDRKVSERTKELNDSVLASLNMMEDAVRQRENTEQADEKLNYLAYYDALTGLANRSLFLERVAQYMRSAVSDGHKLALFLIDLERFKNINDELGRPAGDALLRQVAEWLTQNRGDANLLARVGADHFAVVLPEVTDEGDVAPVLEKTIQNLLDHPFRLDDTVFRIAAKFGVALFPDDGAKADILFKNAEAALKKAKASGDRYLFYTQKMTEKVAGKLTLENQLRQALDKEEFVLHYQPKVNFESGMVTGAEALIRWNDPLTGLVPPGRFIPILEETGLIYEVGRWALRKAIADHLRWRNAGLAAVRIAVNVSPLQLRNRTFIAEIEQAIGFDAHAAAGLELEITESMIMDDVKQSIASLQAIRTMGVSIAIDDFGTGFSSLGYLSKLPVDTLKIDRSFVIDMTSGPQGLALVSTIINLAHSLKLNVVAEGVETEEQSRLLRLLNCDEMQGFLFSKPVPSEIFETRYLTPPLAA